MQEGSHWVVKCAYIYKRCIDVIGELLTSSHGENDSVEVIWNGNTTGNSSKPFEMKQLINMFTEHQVYKVAPSGSLRKNATPQSTRLEKKHVQILNIVTDNLIWRSKSITSWYMESVLFYGFPSFLRTWNNLQNSVLLHVGRKVPRSHVLLHYSHVGQFLGEKSSKQSVTNLQMFTILLLK